MPRISWISEGECNLGPVDMCAHCHSEKYSALKALESPDYDTGDYECFDCGKPLTHTDDPRYKPPRNPYLGNYTTAMFLLMELIALAGSVYAWVVFGSLWGFVVGIVVTGIATGWLHRQISNYLNYEPPDFVNIKVGPLERKPDKLITGSDTKGY